MRRTLWEQAGMATLLAQMGRECPGNADGQALPQRVEISTSKTKAIQKVKLRQLKKNPL